MGGSLYNLTLGVQSSHSNNLDYNEDTPLSSFRKVVVEERKSRKASNKTSHDDKLSFQGGLTFSEHSFAKY